MVFPDGLRIVNPAVQVREVVLRDTDNGLDSEDDVGDQPEDGVGGLEMRASVADLVVLDYDQAGKEGQDRSAIKDGVNVGASTFLLRCVGRLEDEDCLSSQENAGGVEELRGSC